MRRTSPAEAVQSRSELEDKAPLRLVDAVHPNAVCHGFDKADYN